MRRSLRVLLPAALAIGVATVLSGCLSYSGAVFSKTALKPGKTSVATVHSFPPSKSSSRDYPFFFLSLPQDGSLKLVKHGRALNTNHVFGHRPKKLVSDPELRDYIVNNTGSGLTGTCTDFVNSSSRYVAVRTQHPLRTHGKGPGTQVLSKLPIKQVHLADSSTFEPIQIAIAEGTWQDDNNNGVVGDGGSGETVTCSGGTKPTFKVKRASSKHKQTRSERLRAAKRQFAH